MSVVSNQKENSIRKQRYIILSFQDPFINGGFRFVVDNYDKSDGIQRRGEANIQNSSTSTASTVIWS